MKISLLARLQRAAITLMVLNLVAPIFSSSPALAITCTSTVVNTNDSGAGSLRTAMQSGGTICFNISGSGAHTITPASALPTITAASTTIDGTTQPGYTGAPLIEINGANAGSTPGIIVSASGVTIKGLVVNRFNSDGIYLAAGGNTTVQANYVGTDPTGTIARGNTHSGIGMQTAGNHIGGTTAAERNLVSGNLQSGIAVNGSSSTGNVISGNYVGTDVTGTFAITNGGDGVLVTAAPNTTVGGTTGVTPGGACTGACNLLSGNAANGAGISGSTATGNVVAGNYIGTDVNGLYPIGNYDIGVEAQDAPSNTIGGTTPASRNVIGGNVGAGVSLTGSAAANNSVTGNYIGTDRSGNGSMPNHKMGINIGSPSGGSNNAHNNNIGGTTGVTPGGACTGACNVIVSSFWSGIYISGASGGSNTIAGNFIGVTANGFNAGGNVQDGIGIVDSPGNIIGGSSAAQRNLISGNGGSGVALVGASTGGNHIEGNYIGQRTDQGDMPNAGSGVAIANGVTTAVVGNNISGNGILGIDIFPGWVSQNDPGDGDGGPNGTQNFPVLSSAIPLGGNESIAGSLNSLPNTTFRIEFFKSPACSGQGYGQGHDYLGSYTVVTDGAGNTGFTATMPLVIGGMAITATATRVIGSTPAETSEFSKCINTPRTHPDGTLIRPVGSSNVFLTEAGTVRPIGSGEVLASYHMTSAEFKTATNADTSLPGGANLYFREGTLIKGSGPNVYVIDQTSPSTWTKRLITDIGFFTGLGYTAADIIIVPDSALGAADGPVIGSTVQHPDGTLVKSSAGTIYLIENGQKRLVGSMPMFTTQRYSLSSTKNATSTDLGLPNGSNLNFREGAVIKGSGPNVYVVDDNGTNIVKRQLGSVSAMIELGYGSADVVTVPDQELPSIDGPGI